MLRNHLCHAAVGVRVVTQVGVLEPGRADAGQEPGAQCLGLVVRIGGADHLFVDGVLLVADLEPGAHALACLADGWTKPMGSSYSFCVDIEMNSSAWPP